MKTVDPGLFVAVAIRYYVEISMEYFADVIEQQSVVA